MKKYLIITILFLVVGMAVFCVGINSNNVKLQLNIYYYGKPNTLESAYISIKEDNVFQFCFSPLSSYIYVGKYTVQDDIVFCNTDDGQFEFIFTIDQDALVFDKNRSTNLPEYSKIDDGAVFNIIP